MPQNFRTSYARFYLKKGLQLPCSLLRPKLDHSCTYPDLITISGFSNVSNSILDRKHYRGQQPQFIGFALRDARGVPIPDKSQVQRAKIFYREAFVGLYDANVYEFAGNIARVKATWNEQNEDIWVFDESQKNNELLIKINEFDAKRDGHLKIFVELVMHYLPNNISSNFKQYGTSDMEMSCCYGMLSLSELLEKGVATVQMIGGEPSKPIMIQKEDLRTERSGWQYIAKALGDVKSSLNVTLLQLPPAEQDLALVLPDRMLYQRLNVRFFHAYREYFAYRAFSKHEINEHLPNDHIFKTFQKVVNCVYTNEPIGVFWRNEVVPTFKEDDDLSVVYQKLEKVLGHLYLLFSSKSFRFQSSDPASSCFCFQMAQARQAQVTSALQDLRAVLQIGSQQNLGNLKLDANPLPFRLDEMFEDDDDETLMFENYASKKTRPDKRTEKL